MIFTRNTRSIKEIYDDFGKGILCVDDGYQRKKVWSVQDNVRFIETILLGMVTPEVFFWTAEVDPTTGRTITHIVDGQQRISAIVDYIDGEFDLGKRYLLDENITCAIGGKRFSELTEDKRSEFWMYQIPIVSIDRSCTRNQIVEAFKRLNLTEYSLNAQERRHSDENNAFGRASEMLAESDFWEECRVFSASDAKRMKDVSYCCSILILAVRGIIDQSDNTAITRFYEDYSDSFDEDASIVAKVETAMDLLSSVSSEPIRGFLSKKSQLYTLFSLAFFIDDEKIALSEDFEERLSIFITAYNLFKNSVDYVGSDEKTRAAFELVKKYKLASSEGVNKGTNRTIRFAVLKDICLANNSTVDMESLIRYLSNQS